VFKVEKRSGMMEGMKRRRGNKLVLHQLISEDPLEIVGESSVSGFSEGS
jgi:hypothetical protein